MRHNLSINPNFRKGRKSQGAGHYWRLCNTEESLGQREYTTIVEDERTASPHESSELEQACKYLEGELQREDSLDGVKIDPNINGQLENGMYVFWRPAGEQIRARRTFVVRSDALQSKNKNNPEVCVVVVYKRYENVSLVFLLLYSSPRYH